MPNSKAQTSLEYLFLLGGVLVTLIAVIIITRGNVFGTTSGGVDNTTLTINQTFASVQGKAPVISNVQVTVRADTAIISWQTDQLTSSSVAYKPSAGTVDSYAGSTTQVSSHKVTISNMPLTTYSYQVTSCNTQSLCATSSPGSFTIVFSGICPQFGQSCGSIVQSCGSFSTCTTSSKFDAYCDCVPDTPVCISCGTSSNQIKGFCPAVTWCTWTCANPCTLPGGVPTCGTCTGTCNPCGGGSGT
ncbi:MAG: class III signal peptide-containing protein [Candidatus Micrarchaeota archaeon]